MTGADGPEFSWQQLFVAAARALEDVSTRISTGLAEVATTAETWTEAARPVLEDLVRVAQRFQEAYEEGVPSGWQMLETGQMLVVIDLMARTGWCLTTSPPAEILVRLLSMSDDEAGQLLLAAEPRILDDLDRELRAIRSDALPTYAAAARQAWEAHTSGLFIASQATSTATLSALSDARGPLAIKNLGAARNRLERLDIEDAGLREIRFYAVARAVAAALRNFPPGAPEPARFNRHASAHGMSARQYTQLNSLTSLMLTCGWLRELVWLMTTSRSDDQPTQRRRR